MKKEETGSGTVAEYIKAQDPAAAQSLQETREQILAAVPGATELISYQIPTIKYREAPLLAYAAYPKHCSLYTMSKAVMERYSDELSGYKKTATAVHFGAGTTLPATLLLKIIADRMAETDFMLQQREAKKMARRMAAKKGRS
ncbi:iron chaperone [Pedobacter yulinensis]|nr:DUF1801 domain-containing protein [Pedobacter yulinensis]